MNIEAYLVLAALLFAVDVLGFLLRRNVIIAFISVELVFSTANLALMISAHQHGRLNGQVVSFFVMVAAAIEVVVGLVVIVAVYRTRRSASVDDANLLKF